MLYLIIALAALLLTGFFAGSETGFISANPIKLKVLARQGDKRARIIEKMLDRPGTFLGTVLIGTNIMVTVFSSFFTIHLSGYFDGWLVVLISTSCVLIFGEIIPKSLYREYSYFLSRASAPLIQLSYYLLKPFIVVTTAFSNLLLRVLRIPSQTREYLHSRASIMRVIQEGRKAGVVEPEEHEIISRVFTFRDIKVGQIMLPREKIISVTEDTSFEDLKNTFIRSGRSRLPVYDRTGRRIRGMIYAFDLLLSGPSTTLEELIKPVYFVNVQKRCDHLLEELKHLKSMIAIVTDAQQEVVGLVSMEDLLERLVGKIEDEHDQSQPNK